MQWQNSGEVKYIIPIVNYREFKSDCEGRGFEFAMTRLERSLLSLAKKATKEELDSLNLFCSILQTSGELKGARSISDLREKLDRQKGSDSP